MTNKIDESEILKKLLSFDTQNFDDLSKVAETNTALDYVANLLDKNGIKSEFQNYDIKDEKGDVKKRKNLIAKIEKGNFPSIGLEGHIDTVPVGNYKSKPFGEEKDGRIYGRGAVDMKGSLAGMIYTMIEAKNHDLKTNPYLIITSDEEANNFAGIRRYLQNNPKLDFVICGEPSNLKIDEKFRGAAHGIITIFGKAAHSANPSEAENAIEKGYPVLETLIKTSERISEITNDDFKSDNPNSHKSALTIGIIRAGNKVNVIPDEMRIEYALRIVKPFEEYKKLIDDSFSKFIVKTFDLYYKFGIDPAILDISKDNPFYDKLNLLGERNGRIGLGLPEANLIMKAGIPAAVYGVGNEFTAHTNEEFVEIADLKKYSQKLLEVLK